MSATSHLLGYVVGLLLHEPQHNLSPSCVRELLLQLGDHLLNGLSQVTNEDAAITKPPDIHRKESVIPKAALQLQRKEATP